MSNEDKQEGDSSQTTVAVILVIAWCLVAIVAFFYYKNTKTGIMNDILCLEYCFTWYALKATLHYLIYLIGSAKESKEENNQKVSFPNVTNEDKNEGVQSEAVEPEGSLASVITSAESTTSEVPPWLNI